jgi:hypothetical protein
VRGVGGNYQAFLDGSRAGHPCGPENNRHDPCRFTLALNHRRPYCPLIGSEDTTSEAERGDSPEEQ